MKLTRPIHGLKREAKRLSRKTDIPLHRALDSVAMAEGFAGWSLLAAKASEEPSPAQLYARLSPGDLLLIGARPGQGKTLLALRLAIEAMRAGNRAAFFTLEYAERDVLERLRAIGVEPAAFQGRFDLDCSNDISAGYVVERLASAPRGTFVAIDYLQLLDQKRHNPHLPEQVGVFKAFARARGLIVALVSQIDRSYDPARKRYPCWNDIRLPNPLDLALFDKACFLNGGGVRFEVAD